MNKKIIFFGVEDLKVAELVQDDSTGASYGSELLHLEGCQNLKISEITTEQELRGDNGIVDTRSKREGYEIEIAHGVMTLDQLKLMFGGEIVETFDAVDTTKIIKRRYIQRDSDKGKPFGLIGVAEEQKVILPKVVALNVDIPFQTSTHAVVNIKAKAFKRVFDGVMRIMDQNETTTAPALTDFDV